MLLKKTNIEAALTKAKNRQDEFHLMDQVYKILDNHVAIQGSITQATSNPLPFQVTNEFEFDLLETNRIFHIDQIRETCVDYRLRFLDTKYFKGQIPKSALKKIKELEQLHNITIRGYKIMAPSKLFKLADKDDPLLFALIGNGYYYLIHKWGNDLHPLRRLMAWPFKNIINLAALVLLLSFLVTLLLPTGLFSKSVGATEFWIVFFFMFKSIAAVVIFYGFALGKNFNPAIWKSKYYNA